MPVPAIAPHQSSGGQSALAGFIRNTRTVESLGTGESARAPLRRFETFHGASLVILRVTGAADSIHLPKEVQLLMLRTLYPSKYLVMLRAPAAERL